VNGGAQEGWKPWSAPVALVFGIAMALVADSLITIPAVALGVNANNPPGWLVIVDSVVQDGCLVGAAWLFASRIATPRPRQFGLVPIRLWSGFKYVAFGYAAFFAVTLIWVALVGSTKEQVLQQLGANNGSLGVLFAGIFTCAIAPICEELFFRGFFFRAVRNWKGFWPAAIITGIFFGGIHIGSAPAADLVPLGLLGVILCVVYERSGSLLPCIAIHVTNNSLAFGGQENWTVAGTLLLLVLAFALVWSLLSPTIRWDAHSKM
jgi:membrane protease YdiL (CAAX protease family)